jgi:hypothetical protein
MINRTYTVLPNDTAESIARKFTGRADIRALVVANPNKPWINTRRGTTFSTLTVGETLNLPNGWQTAIPIFNVRAGARPYGSTPLGILAGHRTVGLGASTAVTSAQTNVQLAQTALGLANTRMSAGAADTTPTAQFTDYAGAIGDALAAAQSAKIATGTLVAFYNTDSQITSYDSAVTADISTIQGLATNTTAASGNGALLATPAQTAVNAASDAITQAQNAIIAAQAVDAATPTPTPAPSPTPTPTTSYVQCANGTLVPAGQACPPVTSTNWTPWIVGAVAVAIGVGTVVYFNKKDHTSIGRQNVRQGELS